MGCCSSKEDGEKEPLIQEKGVGAETYGGAPCPVTIPTGGVVIGDDGMIVNSGAPTVGATSVLVSSGVSLPGGSFIADAAGDMEDDSKGVDPADAAVQKVQQQLISINAEPVTVTRSEAEKRSREYGVVAVSKPLATAPVDAVLGIPAASVAEPAFTSADLPTEADIAAMEALGEAVSTQVALKAMNMGPVIAQLPPIPDFMKQ